MSCGVNLYSYSSLVRVVLIDTCRNNYLVFESYPYITTETMFDMLDGLSSPGENQVTGITESSLSPGAGRTLFSGRHEFKKKHQFTRILPG